uniref:General transcription and DNA repair factor IIH n=1 Tax=Kwoniella bestiolae CBS 10118 TaxID=1296100 RepID=A0A1B9FVT3_9TREE|nr:transcription initiation factor TFIIH subunit 2 [Kwoniella bestiolae CBS 10118]OCF22884.1 transcription initiation factor TFIIH subunit 2 [Kwoniella bestiolae CBS 10118]
MPLDLNYAPGAADEADDDFIDDDDLPGPSSRGKKGGASGGKGGGKGKDPGRHAWEAEYKKSWDIVQEDEKGSLESAVESLLARGRRKRALMADTPLRRSIIRHMFIILDLSDSMMDKDYRPTSRFEVILGYLRTYVVEWFDQNPLGQIGIIIMRDRLSEVLVPMGGNPQEILSVLSDKRKLEPSGEPSLQNGLMMAKGGMSHLPTTSSLETLIIFSSISTADPDGPVTIHNVLQEMVDSKIRTNILSLSGEIKICKQISERTNGKFGVALDQDHLKDLMWDTIPPPATTIAPPITVGVRNALAGAGAGQRGGAVGKAPAGDLMVMGFPIQLPLGGETLCACHGLLKKGGYLCPRCGSKLCDVPTDCEVCGLMVVSSPHLARSFWFLFPVANYRVLAIEDVMDSINGNGDTCFGCDVEFPDVSTIEEGVAQVEDGVSPTGRYRWVNVI